MIEFYDFIIAMTDYFESYLSISLGIFTLLDLAIILILLFGLRKLLGGVK